MGQDNKNLFNNRLGMRPSRNLSPVEELNRISADSNPQAAQPAQNPQSISTSDDIVLNTSETPKNRSKKRILYIFGFAVVILVALAAVSMAATKGKSIIGVATFSNEKLKSVLDSYSEDAIEYDDILISIEHGATNGEALFTEESYNEITKDYEAVNNLKKGLSDFSTTDDETKTEALKNLKDELNANSSVYEKSYEIYSDYYTAITARDKTKIEKYLDQGDEIIKATNAYIKYIETYADLTKITNQIEKSNCNDIDKVSGTLTRNCLTLYDKEYEYKSAIQDNNYLKAVFHPTLESYVSKEKILSHYLIELKDLVE